MLPLSLVRPGERVRILGIVGGKGIVGKLANMGFYPGVIIEVISNGRPGPVIVAREGIRLGIGLGMAHKIFVQPLS